MIWLSLARRWWPAIALVALLGVSHWWLYHNGRLAERAEWQPKWSERDARDAQAQADAQLTQRTEEQRRADWAAGVQRDATQEIERARLDADGASADARRLRDQLGKLQSRLSGSGKSPGAAISSASTTRAALVLSQLLDRCVGQRQELASAFDRSRIAGLACERSYDGLQSHEPQGANTGPVLGVPIIDPLEGLPVYGSGPG